MSTKEKTQKTQKTQKTRQKLNLSKVDLLRLNFSHISQIALREGISRRYAQAEHRILEAEKDAQMLREEARIKTQALEEAKIEHKKILLGLSDKYNVDFSKTDYDVDTGKIHLDPGS